MDCTLRGKEHVLSSPVSLPLPAGRIVGTWRDILNQEDERTPGWQSNQKESARAPDNFTPGAAIPAQTFIHKRNKLLSYLSHC